jgi:hypothetical protein
VKRLEGKPFAFLGVNLDNSKEDGKRVVNDRQINWRSWYNGRGGPIAPKYGIQYLPTVYVIDHKGVIRHKDLRDKALDDAVDALVKEIEKDKAAE